MAKVTSTFDKEWQTEQDVRTLMEAQEIREDPKRLAAAQACAKEKLLDMAAISAITGTPKDRGDKS